MTSLTAWQALRVDHSSVELLMQPPRSLSRCGNGACFHVLKLCTLALLGRLFNMLALPSFVVKEDCENLNIC